MPIERVNHVDLIEVRDNGLVSVVFKNIVKDDEETISCVLSRKHIAPGDDYSEEDDRVQAICGVTHTPEVIAAYEAHLAAQEGGQS